jgi:putative transposase
MAAIADKDRKCREIELRISQGGGVCESCREFGVSEKTFYRWRKEQREATKG